MYKKKLCAKMIQKVVPISLSVTALSSILERLKLTINNHQKNILQTAISAPPPSPSLKKDIPSAPISILTRQKILYINVSGFWHIFTLTFLDIMFSPLVIFLVSDLWYNGIFDYSSVCLFPYNVNPRDSSSLFYSVRHVWNFYCF